MEDARRPVSPLLKLRRLVAVSSMAMAMRALCGDESLLVIDIETAMRLAVESSSELERSRTQLISRRRAFDLGARQLLPSLSLDLGGDERLDPSGPDSFRKSAGMTVTATAWDGGKALNSRKLEEVSLRLAETEFRIAERRVKLNALSSYLKASAAEAKLAIALDAHAAALELRDISVLGKSMGLIPESDLLEAELAVAEAEIGVMEGKFSLDGARRDFETTVLRFKPLSGFSLKPFDASFAGADLGKLRETIMRQASATSVDLEKSRLELEAMKIEIDRQAFAFLPDIELSLQGKAGGNRFPLNEFSWSCSVTLKFDDPLLPMQARGSFGDAKDVKTAGWSSQASPLSSPQGIVEKGTAKRLFDIAIADLGAAERQTERAAGDAVNSHTMKKKILEAKRSGLAMLRKKAELTLILKQAGKATQKDLNEAARAVAEADVTLIDSVADLVLTERSIEIMADLEENAFDDFQSIREGTE